MPRKRTRTKEVAAARMRRSDVKLPVMQGLLSPHARARLHRWWVYFSLKLHIARDNPHRRRRF